MGHPLSQGHSRRATRTLTAVTNGSFFRRRSTPLHCNEGIPYESRNEWERRQVSLQSSLLGRTRNAGYGTRGECRQTAYPATLSPSGRPTLRVCGDCRPPLFSGRGDGRGLIVMDARDGRRRKRGSREGRHVGGFGRLLSSSQNCPATGSSGAKGMAASDAQPDSSDSGLPSSGSYNSRVRSVGKA